MKLFERNKLRANNDLNKPPKFGLYDGDTDDQTPHRHGTVERNKIGGRIAREKKMERTTTRLMKYSPAKTAASAETDTLRPC
uniref:Uncharacterized protein n=1 Tax=Angiostrongylus cantonensis TaxID=6313 RepID=A0A0K0DLY5_ANGCA